MSAQLPVAEISVVELKQRIDKGQAPVILDVREAHELQIASLPDCPHMMHIPLGQLPQRINELTPYKAQEIVVYCRSGGRSLMAANYLQQNGFQHAFNLKGGVLAWSREIDPAVQQY